MGNRFFDLCRGHIPDIRKPCRDKRLAQGFPVKSEVEYTGIVFMKSPAIQIQIGNAQIAAGRHDTIELIENRFYVLDVAIRVYSENTACALLFPIWSLSYTKHFGYTMIAGHHIENDGIFNKE